MINKIYLSLLDLINVFKFKVSGNHDIILCYHEVNGSSWSFSISPALFESHIKTLNNNCTIVDLKTILTTKNKSTKPRIAITFDDGWYGVYKYAFPILKKYNVKSTVFVIGKPDLKMFDMYSGKFLANIHMRKLASSGWEIGWHTNYHLDLSQVSRSEQTSQIAGYKEFSKKNKLRIKSLAYPFGSYSDQTVKIARKSGLKFGFTVDGGMLNKRNLFKINRVTIPNGLTTSQLLGLITPFGLSINKTATGIWKIKDNLFRNQN